MPCSMKCYAADLPTINQTASRCSKISLLSQSRCKNISAPKPDLYSQVFWKGTQKRDSEVQRPMLLTSWRMHSSETSTGKTLEKRELKLLTLLIQQAQKTAAISTLCFCPRNRRSPPRCRLQSTLKTKQLLQALPTTLTFYKDSKQSNEINI